MDIHKFKKSDNMKYRFITVMHNMGLENIKNRGIAIFKRGRITNGNQILRETAKEGPIKQTLGIHSFAEFDKRAYMYIDGELNDLTSKKEMDKIGGMFTFYLLRLAQQFTYELWYIKDNNIYLRDGFLLAYSNDYSDGFTYKASLSAIFQYANYEQRESIFTDNEISLAASRFEYTNFDRKFDYKKPSHNLFFKSRGSERLDRALYFVLSARTAILPMRIFFYINALECLFTIDSQGISHKISERVAILLGKNLESKRDLYRLIKKSYGVRSKLIHGQYLKEDVESLIEIAVKLDIILRKLLTKHQEVFKKNDREIEEYFTNLIFT